MLESSMEEWVCGEAEKAGWLQRKLRWIGRRNAADRFFAKDGRVLLIEFKRTGEKPRGTQDKEIKALKAAGVEVHVCDNPIQALSILGVAYVPGQ